MRKPLLIVAVLASFLLSCGNDNESSQTENAFSADSVQAYLDGYNETYGQLAAEASEAAWVLNTHIVEGDTMAKYKAGLADQAYADFTGSKENIEKARFFLEHKEKLTILQQKQLEKILYMAANNPGSLPELVKERIDAENTQTETLYGFNFILNNDTVSTNDLDSILKDVTDMDARLNAWNTSKEVGKGLKAGLLNLRDLRNKTVQGLGYDDYFTYQVSDYGMTREEMMDLTHQMIREVWPMYRELHTYARYELAQKYGTKEIPEMLPAHWLSNRWGQDWSGMVTVEGLDLDGILQEKGDKWLMKQAERFYISLGMPELPGSFYEKSSLYPLPEGADYKKNNHASAWHMDLKEDVRSLMSVKPNAEWYETVHHELGHIYYYMTYTNPEVPLLLREGANRGYHEAMGSMLGLAAMQKPFLANLDLLPADSETDEMQTLLKEALNYIVFIPWSAGVMSEFEHDLYAKNLPADQLNQRWWELKKQYQGIVPGTQRGEEYCDAASKTHINNDAAQYYDYAISYILLFQIHDHIANNILKQDPRATNYYGNKEVGDFLKSLMRPGASADWRKLLEEKTGEGLSAKAMLNYFAPLMEYLQKANQGRVHTLPETI